MLDQIQHGEVVHVGFRSEDTKASIRKTSLSGKIDVEPGGVVGDYHFQYEIDWNPAKKFRLLHFQHYAELIKRQGGKLIHTLQISLYESEEYDRMQSIPNADVLYDEPYPFRNFVFGMAGENITTSGIRLNEIRQDSIILIGDVRLKVKARRSYCKRMFTDLPPAVRALWWMCKNNHNSLGEHRVGIICQVLDKGIIQVGDKITVHPIQEKIGTPWITLPSSGEGKITNDRVEYIPPEVT